MAATDLMNDLNQKLAEVKEGYESELAALKSSYEQTITSLKDQVVASANEAALAKDALTIARNSELVAHRTMASLLAQFGAVAAVFAQAKSVAEQAGLMIAGTVQTVKTDLSEAEQKVESAAHAGLSDLDQATKNIEDGLASLLHRTTTPLPPVSPSQHQ